MKLTVLGRSAACPNPGEACSSYLVEQQEALLVLDCGTGAVSRLRQLADFRRVSAVVITHMHFDHFADIIPYTYGLKLANPVAGHRPTLLLPPGGEVVLNAVVGHWPDLSALIYEAFKVHEFDPGAAYSFGSLQVRFTATQHYVPCWGISILEGSRKLAYSSDAGPSSELLSLAAGADIFICEASIGSRTDNARQYGHLTPRDAGEIAAGAQAKKLLLSHFWQEFDQARMVAEAREVFNGQVEIAGDMKSYLI